MEFQWKYMYLLHFYLVISIPQEELIPVWLFRS